MALFNSLLVLVVGICSILLSLMNAMPTKFKDPESVTDEIAEDYLSRFGYLKPLVIPKSGSIDAAAAKTKAEEKRREAISHFQFYAKLPITGELDETTKRKMLAPRCGVSDTDSLKRSGEFKWDKQDLTWRIEDFTADLDEGMQRLAITEAFQKWSEVTPLRFTEVPPGEVADIVVRFGRDQHGDYYPFDGVGTVLAHAFYPKDGRCHFDDDETWQYGDANLLDDGVHTDLLTVAVHELGHVLGLPHSDSETAIMGAFYEPHVGADGRLLVQLDQDDIQQIQLLYGPRDNAGGSGGFGGNERPPEPPTTEPTTTIGWDQPTTTESSFGIIPNRPKRPDSGFALGICPSNIDSIVDLSNEELLIFSGNMVWTFREGRGFEGPTPLQFKFPRGPDSVDNSMNKFQKRIILLSRGSVYAYDIGGDNSLQLADQFPKPLPAELSFRPETIFQWTDGNLILLQGSNENGPQFATWDENWNQITYTGLASDYFPNIPKESPGAFQWQGNMYFFAQNQLHLYDTRAQGVTKTLSINDFFNCLI